LALAGKTFAIANLEGPGPIDLPVRSFPRRQDKTPSIYPANCTKRNNPANCANPPAKYFSKSEDWGSVSRRNQAGPRHPERSGSKDQNIPLQEKKFPNLVADVDQFPKFSMLIP
jgi:hypothetical protein